MNEIIKYKISSDFSDEILIDWYPSMVCNFNCSYCFVTKKNQKFNKNNFLIFKDFLNNTVKKNKRIKLRILGGEPSLIPNFNDYLKLLDEKIIIELVTNGTGNIKDLTRLNSIEVSLHLEYWDKYKDKIKKNIFHDNLKQIKKTIVINIHNYFKKNRDILNKYKLIINNLKLDILKLNIENISFSINPLILNNEKNSTIDFKYFKTFFNIHDLLENEHSHEYKLYNYNSQCIKNITYDDYLEIYRIRKNNFKNNICFNNYFKIDYFYNIVYNCNDKKIGNILSDKIDLKIKPIKCQNNYCDEGCFMDCKKIFKHKGLL